MLTETLYGRAADSVVGEVPEARTSALGQALSLRAGDIRPRSISPSHLIDLQRSDPQSARFGLRPMRMISRLARVGTVRAGHGGVTEVELLLGHPDLIGRVSM